MISEKREIRLLGKRHSGLRQLLFGRMTVALILLIGQLLMMLAVFAWFEDYCLHYVSSIGVIAAFMVLWILNTDMESSARTSWLIIIMAAPVFGSLLYLFTCRDIGHRLLRRRLQAVLAESKDLLQHDGSHLQQLSREDPGAAALCNFLAKDGYAVFANSTSAYLPDGERMLEQLLKELDKAEKYIYMEYFIISEGTFWGSILNVLARKAAAGVDVRILYDGTTEFVLLPKGYAQKLEKLGIQCKVFSPISPFVSTHYNYRDHRKITVIDGQTAFTGGINLSDEYINIGSRFGHWKDTAVMLRGEAVAGFTRMFLQMWNVNERSGNYQALDIPSLPVPASGFLIPYGDNPLDEVRTGEAVYMDMINRAVESVWIMTPYLILDSEMESCVKFAAKRGVTVRLILPGIPDKYIPYALAKTHYKALIDSGVQIYEYTPGFVHAKVLVADGREAVVGTINFDYRSFWHHFECGVYMYRAECIPDILHDLEQTLQQSRVVSNDSIRKEKWHRKLTGFLLKGFSPLL